MNGLQRFAEWLLDQDDPKPLAVDGVHHGYVDTVPDSQPARYAVGPRHLNPVWVQASQAIRDRGRCVECAQKPGCGCPVRFDDLGQHDNGLFAGRAW